MSVSHQAHRIYRIYGWDLPFVDYGADGNTFEGCMDGQFEDTRKCPEELDIILAGIEEEVYGIACRLPTNAYYPVAGAKPRLICRRIRHDRPDD